MRISCPDCRAQYVVPNSSISINGRKVKCFKCSYVWFVKPDSEAEHDGSFDAALAPEAVNSIQSDNILTNVNLPQVINHKTSIFWKIAPVICVLLTFFCFFILQPWHFRQFETAEKIYRVLGLRDSELLSLQNVKIEKIPTGDILDIVFSGNIINNSHVEKRIPHIRFSILDENKVMIASEVITTPPQKLKPGERFPVKFTFYKSSPRAVSIAVDIGSKLELWLR